MLKKLLISLIFLVAAFAIAAPSLLGFSILNLPHAIKVATHMSAKLACSSKFISGFDEQLIVNDLASYSPATKLVKLEYKGPQVTASLLGMAQVTATYRDSLGCSLDIGDITTLDNNTAEKPALSNAPWPQGETVKTINPTIQLTLDEILNKDNQQGLNTRALLIVKNGEIIAESYSNNIDAKTPLLGWSMAKSVTAILIARMQQLGMVEVSQTNLFRQWQNDDRKKLNLEQLLQMSSGLAFDETYAPGSDATRMLFTEASASNVALTSPLVNQPASHFSYSSGTSNLLARFIHQQLGGSTKAATEFLYQELFAPLAMSNTFFEVDSSGVLVGSSYVYAPARDWARLGLLMLNKGKINHQQVIDPGWVKRATQPNSSSNDKRYGYQFWLNAGGVKRRWPALPSDAYAMLGNRQQSVMIIPSKNTVLIRLGWTKGDYPMEQNYQRLLQLIN